MGSDLDSCFPWHQQLPNLNYLDPSVHLGRQTTDSAFIKPGTSSVSVNGTSSVSLLPDLPRPKLVQGIEHPGWFYCMPNLRQAFVPTLSSVIKENLPAAPVFSGKETVLQNVVSGFDQKRLLVFDQSGDQTTLIFSSGKGTPVQQFTSWNPKPYVTHNLEALYPETKQNVNDLAEPLPPANALDENDGSNIHSEMHEDTEELNALLYSDTENGSDYTEDDEVTSADHSSNAYMACDKREFFRITIEEDAASSDECCTKKRKLSSGGYNNVLSHCDATGSEKPVRNCNYVDDAESSCNIGIDTAICEMGSEESNKRVKIERIQKTVNVLQNILPGGKGKGAVTVLNEAIQYLKTLKLKAKDLGLDALEE